MTSGFEFSHSTRRLASFLDLPPAPIPKARRLAVGEAGVELLADFEGETGDFTVACLHIALWFELSFAFTRAGHAGTELFVKPNFRNFGG